MQEVFKAKLAGYGQWTYRGAWALEILAAALGLSTGLALGYQAFSNADVGSVTSIDLVLASAPFFMVAIAELTKIPIATLLFTAQWAWKPLIFVFLIGLASITFETVFMGLERAATLRQLKYEELVGQIKKNEIERNQISSRMADAAAVDAVKEARENFERVLQQADQERSIVDGQLRAAERDMEGKKVLLPGALRVREAVEAKIAERDRLLSRRDSEIAVAIREFESQRESFVERIKAARTSGDTESARRYEAQLDRLPNPRRRIEPQYQSLIAPLNAEINSLNAEFDKIQSLAAPMSAADAGQLESRRDELRLRAANVDREWSEQLSDARKRLDDAQAIEQLKRQGSLSEQRRKDELSIALSDLETRRIEFARTDQIRRIAARFYGSRPESVSDDQVGFVTVAWFGSLALLAALAGPLTAIVALSLQRIGTSPPTSNKLANTIRRLLLSWRWRRVRTVQVPQEVIVEREVERKVEVPVDRVIKEILYVPVLTDDPEAIRRSLNDTLPNDMANLVKATFKAGKHGG